MKKRLIFVENHKALMVIMPYLRMLGAKKIKKVIVPGTYARMVSFKLRTGDYISMVNFFDGRYPGEISFLTIGR